MLVRLVGDGEENLVDYGLVSEEVGVAGGPTGRADDGRGRLTYLRATWLTASA